MVVCDRRCHLAATLSKNKWSEPVSGMFAWTHSHKRIYSQLESHFFYVQLLVSTECKGLSLQRGNNRVPAFKELTAEWARQIRKQMPRRRTNW